MRIVTVAGTQDRSGKTTIAVNLGAELAAAGHSVVLVDLDPDASATRSLGLAPVADPWSTPAAPVAVGASNPLMLRCAGHALAGARGADVSTLLERAADEGDFLITDAPTGGSTLTTAAVEPADVLLAVIKPGPDALAAVKSIAHLRFLLAAGSGELRTVLARVPPGPVGLDRMRAAIEEAYPGALLDTEVPEDPDIAAAAISGLPLRVYAPGAPAGAAFRQLAFDLASRLQGQR